MSPAASSVAAGDGPVGPHIDLSQVQSRTIDFGSASTWDRNSDLQIHPAAKKRNLFGLGPQANTALAGTRSGPEDRLRVERGATNAGGQAPRSDAHARLTRLQGDLGMLLVAQRGEHNDVQVMQGGHNDTSLIDQSGSHNAITGHQSGASNAASITQAGTNQILAYVQSGNGSTLTVRQH